MRAVAFALVMSATSAMSVAACGTVLDLGDGEGAAGGREGGAGADTSTSSDGAAEGAPGDGASGDAAFDAGADAGRHRVFVTRAELEGTMLGGDLDRPCREAALSAGRPGTFRAWLSVTGATAKARVAEYGPWYTTQDSLVANDKGDLTDGSLASAIVADEQGVAIAVPAVAWTGTMSTGTGVGALSCADWSSGGTTGTVGSVENTNYTWTQGALLGCTGTAHVYCFEQP